MSTSPTLFGQPFGLFQLGLVVSGVVIGATAAWFVGKPSVVVTVPVAPPAVPEVKKPEPKEEEEEEDDEEDEEYDSDEDLSEGDEEDAENTPHKLLLIVRTDLKMGPGKIAAQCGHATLAAYKKAKKTNPKGLKYWAHHGQAKVVVKAPSEAEMDAIKKAAEESGISTSVIMDAGRTQIAAGSRTVLALGPAPIAKIDAVAGHLKLY